MPPLSGAGEVRGGRQRWKCIVECSAIILAKISTFCLFRLCRVAKAGKKKNGCYVIPFVKQASEGELGHRSDQARPNYGPGAAHGPLNFGFPT